MKSPFLDLQIRILRNIFRSRSKGEVFKFAVICAFIAGFWAAGLFLFIRAFGFLSGFPGIGRMVADRLIYLTFGIIFIMLTVSSALLSYSAHYRSEELPLLFSMPACVSSIFLYKSLHTVFLSSWASVFLVSPMLIAYGMSRGLGASFYVFSCILFPALAVAAGALGIGVTSLAAGRVGAVRARRAGAGLLLAFLGAVFLALRYRSDYSEAEYLTEALNTLLSHTRVFLFPLLPSYWMAEALLSFGGPDRGEFFLYAALLLSTAALGIIAVEALARRIYFSRWLALRDSSGGGGAALAGLAGAVCFPLKFVIPRKFLTFVVKDVKTFVRDPQQWSQALIFFGLLFAYIANLRKMPYDIEAVFWKKLILFLNGAAIITILGMLSARFAFPLVSFEGKRLWISFFSRVKIRQLVLEKFCVTGAGLFLMGGILVIMLNVMLKTGPGFLPVSLLAAGAASFAFAGLSVGLGAVFPDFKQDNLARISSGFGSALLLVFNMIYICLVIAVSAVPMFIVSEGSRFFNLWVIGSGAFIAALSAAAAAIPLAMGIKSLNRRDF